MLSSPLVRLCGLLGWAIVVWSIGPRQYLDVFDPAIAHPNESISNRQRWLVV